jgi:hypothetical protein
VPEHPRATTFLDKPLGGRSIPLSYPGIRPSVHRQAYGYACRLYALLEETLPPPLSMILVYVILSLHWDSDIMVDPSLVQLFAPKKLGLHGTER